MVNVVNVACLPQLEQFLNNQSDNKITIKINNNLVTSWKSVSTSLNVISEGVPSAPGGDWLQTR